MTAPNDGPDGPRRVADYSTRAAIYAVDYQDTADQPFLAWKVGPGVRNLLEVPCGAGRNAVWLAHTGRRIVACDLEPAMLDALASRYPGGWLPPNLHTRVADLRTLELDERFDLVVVPREALQLLTEEADGAAAVAALARHLAPDGRLVLDLAALRPAGLGLPDGGGLQPSYYDPAQPDGRWTWDWLRALPDGRLLGRWRKQWDRGALVQFDLAYAVYEREADARVDRATARWPDGFCLRRWARGEVEAFAAAAGLQTAAVYADYLGRPHAVGAARLIFDLCRADSDPGGTHDPSADAG